MASDNEKPNPITNIVNTLKANPKALYAAFGAVIVIALVLALSGGGEEMKIKTAISVGQTVTLENPNGGSSQLTTVPGLLSTSEAEEDKEQSVCVTTAGTKAVVEEETVVGMLPFVKVKVADGECAGKSGWTSKINIKAN